ncbi:MAG: hypothetical protein DRP01_03540 [Archaeoglobales archaeon]|nr:MAG: hypothetical protein DRP01_03540 [Archaeoglobales archaeon]
MSTTRLGLPEIIQSQAQKEVTHNQALWQLDALVMPTAIARQSDPPTDPSDGDVYIVIGTATGAWAGHENDIAHYYWGAWHFYTPAKGWQIWVDAEDAWYVYNGTAWVAKDATQPGGPTNAIQYNDGTTFAGSADLTWDDGNKVLDVGGKVKSDALRLSGATKDFGADSVSDPAALVSEDLTDNSGGTATQTVKQISGTGADTDINDNFASITDEINKMRDDIENLRNTLITLLQALRTITGCGVLSD